MVPIAKAAAIVLSTLIDLIGSFLGAISEPSFPGRTQSARSRYREVITITGIGPRSTAGLGAKRLASYRVRGLTVRGLSKDTYRFFARNPIGPSPS